MTWTYDNTLAADRDMVRFTIQDTDTEDQQFQDEEIDATLVSQGTVEATSLYLVRRLAFKYARFVDTSVGDVSESANQRALMYQQLAEDLAAQFGTLASISVGGRSRTVKDALDADSNAVQPKFTKDQFDDPTRGR